MKKRKQRIKLTSCRTSSCTTYLIGICAWHSLSVVRIHCRRPSGPKISIGRFDGEAVMPIIHRRPSNTEPKTHPKVTMCLPTTKADAKFSKKQMQLFTSSQHRLDEAFVKQRQVIHLLENWAVTHTWKSKYLGAHKANVQVKELGATKEIILKQIVERFSM
jgi:hypothetical protein